MAGKDYKIGVYICECGPNIANAVDIDRVENFFAKTPDVFVVKRHKLLCSGPGKDFLHEDIVAEGLTHVVVAACSPKDHETTFANICKKSGVNPYLYQIINIREQCAWMIKDKEAATDKVISYIRAGVRRVKYHSSLEQKELESTPDVLIIGAGIAGIEAALNLASNDRKVYLVEKTAQIGGQAVKSGSVSTKNGLRQDSITKRIEAVERNENIQLFLNSEVEKLIGFFGNFEVVVGHSDGEKTEFKVGAVVVATGCAEFDISQSPKYDISEGGNIFTADEFEKSGKFSLKNGSNPKSAALVHCVGRDEMGYCSGTCCGMLLKLAEALKSKFPDIDIYEIYRNLPRSSPAESEQIENLENAGIKFIRTLNHSIRADSGEVLVSYNTAKGEEKEISVDMAVLAPSKVPGVDNSKIAQMLDLSIDKFGFFEEEHLLTGSVKTSVDGIFVVGGANSPNNPADSVGQSIAACGNILAKLIPGKKLHPEVKTSEVIESLCTGCQTCVTVCSYGATSYDEIRRVSVVNEAICRGCGNCVGSCPSGAIRAKHFTEKQLFQEVIEAIASSK